MRGPFWFSLPVVEEATGFLKHSHRNAWLGLWKDTEEEKTSRRIDSICKCDWTCYKWTQRIKSVNTFTKYVDLRNFYFLPKYQLQNFIDQHFSYITNQNLTTRPRFRSSIKSLLKITSKVLQLESDLTVSTIPITFWNRNRNSWKVIGGLCTAPSKGRGIKISDQVGEKSFRERSGSLSIYSSSLDENRLYALVRGAQLSALRFAFLFSRVGNSSGSKCSGSNNYQSVIPIHFPLCEFQYLQIQILIVQVRQPLDTVLY